MALKAMNPFCPTVDPGLRRDDDSNGELVDPTNQLLPTSTRDAWGGLRTAHFANRTRCALESNFASPQS